MSRDYLVHHGILGQKWGVRRYQNPDGSLTEAGRERYLKQESDSYKQQGSYSTVRGNNQNKIHEGWNKYETDLSYTDHPYSDTEVYKKHAKELEKIFRDSDEIHDTRENVARSTKDAQDALAIRNNSWSMKKYKEFQDIYQTLTQKSINDFDQYAGTVENISMEYINKLPKEEQAAAAAFVYRYIYPDW